MSQPSKKVCNLVDRRDEYRCVRCGVSLEVVSGSRHHRKLRRHGDHTAANLILLHGSGTTGCHGWIHAHPAEAYEQGWMLRSWMIPAEVPVTYEDGSRWLLLLDGTREAVA